MALARRVCEHNPRASRRPSRGSRTLRSAAEAGDLEKVREHVANGANVNARTKAGWFPLGAAVYSGDENVVKFLISRGARVNARSNYGWTPLYMAAREGYAGIVSVLLDSGAVLGCRTKFGFYGSPDRWTALHVAAAEGHLEVVKILVRRGGDTASRDGSGKTPLDLAKAYHRMPVARYLLYRQRLAAATQMLLSGNGGAALRS